MRMVVIVILVAMFIALWLHHKNQVQSLNEDKTMLLIERNCYLIAFKKCNGNRIKVDQILKGDSMKTLVYY